MGARSLTVVLNSNDREICVLYRQYDGYPTGHGAELQEFLSGFQIVNGLGSEREEKIANGMDCLAAQVIAHFKKEAGGFYLYPAGTRDCGEEYIYTLYLHENHLMLRLHGGAVTYFGLPGTKQNNMPILYEGLVELFDPPTIETVWQENERGSVINDFADDIILSSDTLDIPEDFTNRQ